MLTRICPTCGVEYKKPSNCSQISWDERYRVCSRKCKRPSQESIEKMRLKRVGQFSGNKHPRWKEDSNRRSAETKLCDCGCGTEIKKYDNRGRVKKYYNGHALKGKKREFTQEWISNLSISRKGQGAGKNHWNWKGGITEPNHAIRTSAEYKEWRQKVFQRDYFTCVCCGEKPRKIIADHIKPFYFFPELRLDVDNGRTLCKDCDKKIGFNYERDRHLYEKKTA